MWGWGMGEEGGEAAVGMQNKCINKQINKCISSLITCCHHHLLPPTLELPPNCFPLFLPPLLMVSFYRAEVILNCALVRALHLMTSRHYVLPAVLSLMERRECASQNATFKFNHWEVLRQRIIRDLQEVIQSDLVGGPLSHEVTHSWTTNRSFQCGSVTVAKLAASCANPSTRKMAEYPTLPRDFTGPTSRKALI